MTFIRFLIFMSCLAKKSSHWVKGIFDGASCCKANHPATTAIKVPNLQMCSLK